MNYIGSKYTLLDFLTNTISSVTGYPDGAGFVFADLFAGTGVVGGAYRQKGCRVIANDVQYYSYVLNRHWIENDASVDGRWLEHLNRLPGEEGFVYRSYCAGSGSGRNYFTDRNGMRCDAMRRELEALRSSGRIGEDSYFFYLASLINSIDKYANTASVYGAFLKHVKKSAQKEFVLEPLPVLGGPRGTVYNEDVNRLIRRVCGDVLYLDPPYNARQYCSNYHVLETIARYDDPVLKGVTGLRDVAGQKSAYCSSRTVAAAFEDLIAHADFPYIFLSYNNEGLMPLETIRSIMAKHGRYLRFTREYRRFKADKDENRTISAGATTEYLHCLIKQLPYVKE